MFPPGCKNDVTPQSYAFMLYSEGFERVTTTPSIVYCNGGATMMANLPKGKYNVGVVNFNGSDDEHK